MEKGKLGIRLGFYGVAAFVLAFMGWSTALFLLLGVVLVAEKNEWATRQVIQAITLCVAATLISSILSLFNFIGYIPVIGSIWSTFKSVLNSLIDIAVLVFVIMGIVKNIKGQDAKLPLVSAVSDWAYGIAKPKAVKVQPQAAAICTGCGVPLAPGAAFCTTCGKPVNQAAPAQQPQQPQQ